MEFMEIELLFLKFIYRISSQLFLELFIQFGVIGGGIILGYLFYKVLQMIKLCDNDIYKILLVIYLSNSVKLLISDSFWYNGAFWSLIAVLIIWNWQQKRSSKI